MHYYQFNIGDYSSHTRHLSLMEDLAYRRLLELYYLHERPFGDCYATVARLIGMSEYQAEVESVLTEFFEHIDGQFINPRADAEIAHYHSKIEQASRAGKASAQRRMSTRSTDVQPTKNQEPETKKQEPTLSVAPSALDGRFERFWKAYPKKTGKDAALTAFKKRKPDDKLLNEMIFALGQQKKSPEWLKDGGQFIPNPSTWLNQGRWKDEGLELDKPANPFAGDI